LVEIGPVVLEKKSIKEKLTDDANDTNNEERIMTAIAHMSYQKQSINNGYDI